MPFSTRTSLIRAAAPEPLSLKPTQSSTTLSQAPAPPPYDSPRARTFAGVPLPRSPHSPRPAPPPAEEKPKLKSKPSFLRTISGNRVATSGTLSQKSRNRSPSRTRNSPAKRRRQLILFWMIFAAVVIVVCLGVALGLGLQSHKSNKNKDEGQEDGGILGNSQVSGENAKRWLMHLLHVAGQ